MFIKSSRVLVVLCLIDFINAKEASENLTPILLSTTVPGVVVGIKLAFCNILIKSDFFNVPPYFYIIIYSYSF